LSAVYAVAQRLHQRRDTDQQKRGQRQDADQFSDPPTEQREGKAESRNNRCRIADESRRYRRCRVNAINWGRRLQRQADALAQIAHSLSAQSWPC
jgi:hypothetical protein